MIQEKLFYTTKEQELRYIKEQIKDLYDCFPDTIHSDTILFVKYLEQYHNIHTGMSFQYIIGYFKSINKNLSGVESSVRRSGRYWRMRYPDIYKRDDEKTLELELAFKETFRRGEI